MTNHGDDCYFYYYSTCTRGDSCPFRHCEAAMGNETVCNLWQEGRCFRTVCKFRHTEIKKNRKEIPCYWENQPAGCQKPHCAFYHEKPRFINGIYVAPSKGITKNEEQPNEEPAPPPPAPLPTATNPQLRGVMKAETQETVPSPTHPPVVINPADDDEDEDDQFSEEGEDGKVGPDGTRLTSPRKLPGGPKADDSLNFGVSTLEEIRLRKALKASMKKAGYPIQSADTAANGEKENMRSFGRPALYESRDGLVVLEETARPRGSIAERLGKKVFNNDVGGDPALKRSLAERLGRVVDEEQPLLAPQKALKPVRERLGLAAEPVSSAQPAESNTASKNAPEQIRIKTLEEIRQEKAAKSQPHSPPGNPAASAPETSITKAVSTKAAKGSKRTITVKDSTVVHVKTFSEIIHAKKKKQEEEEHQKQEKVPSPKKAKQDPVKTQSQSGAAPTSTEVRVKTLEEIRREKAARMEAQKALEPENEKSADNEEPKTRKPRLLRISKPAALGSISTQKTADVTEKPVKAAAAAAEASPASSNGVKVKTFEEIMREKRLRKQEMEEQASSTSQSKGSAEAEPCQKQAVGPALKRKTPVRASLTPADSSSPSSDSTSTQKPPARKLISLKPKATSPVHSTTAVTTTAAVTAVTSGAVTQSSPPRQAEADSLSQSPSSSRDSPAPSPVKQARAAPTQEPVQKKSPGQTTDTKVRPKLNVKPSVMKPAAQVKPGQKRKAAERSAVAAVKPLNSASTGPEEPLQEPVCKQGKMFPSSSAEAQLSPAVPSSPGAVLGAGSSSSPLTEELQTVPVFQSPVQTKPTISPAAAREACAVPQSSAPKTTAQSKSRRSSVASSRVAAASSSAVDDFEELMNEFTDDHLEADVDPGIGEDDLLQELSEMIDS
ncbi:zinc finger CCCH domain-containing protein 11A isoform X2 [Myripristis murdjan]|uniref:zinc finger CCCH domain-containing protein 11A isoform X2 n=1 Tax=Myripristis murdjan TaxID=586833 RepID=UPI00117600E3|nr:zinc finger CCCH domain-containing protein 11A isoform X2 [Myripristis murdjan]